MNIFTTMMKDRELFIFFFLIIAINTGFVSAIHANVLPRSLYNEGRFLLLGAILVSVVFVFRRLEGLIGLLRPMSVWRVHPLWYLLALLWPPAICVITLLLAGVGNGDVFGSIVLDYETLLRPGVLKTIALGAFIGEIVWVSYAIGKLQKTVSVYLASLIVGVFWTLWWLPIVNINLGVIPNLPLDALFVNMLGVAAMCGFIYWHTKSGLVVLTLQISLNCSGLIFPVNPNADGTATYWLFVIVYFSAVLALYATFGPQIRSSSRHETAT